MTLTRILGTALIGLLSAGCSGRQSDGYTITNIFTDWKTGQRVVEKFVDKDQDGGVEFYGIGPASRDSVTMIDPRWEVRDKVRAYTSEAEAKAFRAKHPEGEMGVRLNAEDGSSMIINGFKATTMDPGMQARVDARFATLTQPSLDYLTGQSKKK